MIETCDSSVIPFWCPGGVKPILAFRRNCRRPGHPSNSAIMKECSVVGCDRSAKTRGWCFAHYARWRSYGDVFPETPISKIRFGKANSNWKGGLIKDPAGRVLVYSPFHPNPTTNGTHVYRYRLVMERELKRFLSPDEVVHHKNGDCTDDRPENLEVMTQSEHASLHMSDRLQKL